jgi:hypothetical protein
MDIKEIRRALAATPFAPIVLRMNDGREFYITNSEFCALTPRDVLVKNSQGAFVHLEPILIASMEEVPDRYSETDIAGSPKDGNGRPG